MKVTVDQTEKLLRGSQPFSQLGFNMMLTRLRKQYSRDPSQSVVQNSMGEINQFLEKFVAIMGADYAIITKL